MGQSLVRFVLKFGARLDESMLATSFEREVEGVKLPSRLPHTIKLELAKYDHNRKYLIRKEKFVPTVFKESQWSASLGNSKVLPHGIELELTNFIIKSI